MKLGAVIVENRFDVNGVIEQHRKFLPSDTEFIGIHDPNIRTMNDYNRLLTSPEFWEQFFEFDRVLIFQHDSGLLRNGIEEFLKWDYIGAPWKFQVCGGNGGLSIRNPRAMYDICKTLPYRGMIDGNEDIYFCNALIHSFDHQYQLAPRSECEKFSVEAVYKLGTFGYHAPSKWLTREQCTNILNQYKK